MLTTTHAAGGADGDREQRPIRGSIHSPRATSILSSVSIPAHHSTEATPGDRGRGLGAAQADRIAATADVYLRLFRLKGLEQGEVLEFGAQALDRIGAFSPELSDETAGIAAGSGLAPELI